MEPGGLQRSRFGAIIRATSGNFLEQFDFFLVGIYADAIAKAFFPTSNEVNGLLLTFTTFWLGALMRPIGAVVLGAYLDHIGRRRGLIITLGIMAMGTVMIACTPGYASIGLLAPALVLLGRLLQGFSAGVELGGVSVYLFEIAKPGHRGFYSSFQSGSQQLAIVVAAIIGYELGALLPREAIDAWGWRIPFAIGCAIVPVIFWIRRSLEETPEFLARKSHPSISEAYRAMRQNIGIVLLGMMMVAVTTVTFYFITVYTPTFARSVLKLSREDSLLVTMCIGLTNFFWLPIGGALSDRIGRKPVLLASAAMILVTTYPLLSFLVDEPSITKLLLVEMILSLYYGLYNGAMVAALTEIVPTEVRTSCFSLAYALAAALFGTFTPNAATLLITWTGNHASPGFWLMAAASCGLVATFIVYRRGETTERPA